MSHHDTTGSGMQRRRINMLLSRLGIVGCVAGILVCLLAGISRLSPPDDSLGAGAIYDRSVDDYNRRLDEIANDNPGIPPLARAKTRTQAHNEDTMLGIVAGTVIAGIGTLLWCCNRSKPNAASPSVARNKGDFNEH